MIVKDHTFLLPPSSSTKHIRFLRPLKSFVNMSEFNRKVNSIISNTSTSSSEAGGEFQGIMNMGKSEMKGILGNSLEVQQVLVECLRALMGGLKKAEKVYQGANDILISSVKYQDYILCGIMEVDKEMCENEIDGLKADLETAIIYLIRISQSVKTSKTITPLDLATRLQELVENLDFDTIITELESSAQHDEAGLDALFGRRTRSMNGKGDKDKKVPRVVDYTYSYKRGDTHESIVSKHHRDLSLFIQHQQSTIYILILRAIQRIVALTYPLFSIRESSISKATLLSPYHPPLPNPFDSFSTLPIERDEDGVYFYKGQYHAFLDDALKSIGYEVEGEFQGFKRMEKELKNILKGCKLNHEDEIESMISHGEMNIGFEHLIVACLGV